MARYTVSGQTFTAAASAKSASHQIVSARADSIKGVFVTLKAACEKTNRAQITVFPLSRIDGVLFRGGTAIGGTTLSNVKGLTAVPAVYSYVSFGAAATNQAPITLEGLEIRVQKPGTTTGNFAYSFTAQVEYTGANLP